MAAGLFLALEIGNTPVSAFQLNTESLGIKQVPSLNLAQVAGGLDDIIGNAIDDIEKIVDEGYRDGEVMLFPSEKDQDEDIEVELGPSQLVLYTPEMQPIIIDHSGDNETKETEMAEIIPVYEAGNELGASTQTVLLA